MAVATLFTSASLQKSCVQPSSSHVTQLFQPSGGVRASPLSTAVANWESAAMKSNIGSSQYLGIRKVEYSARAGMDA
jgi:hypothetical protein